MERTDEYAVGDVGGSTSTPGFAAVVGIAPVGRALAAREGAPAVAVAESDALVTVVVAFGATDIENAGFAVKHDRQDLQVARKAAGFAG